MRHISRLYVPRASFVPDTNRRIQKIPAEFGDDFPVGVDATPAKIGERAQATIHLMQRLLNSPARSVPLTASFCPQFCDRQIAAKPGTLSNAVHFNKQFLQFIL